MIISGDGFTLRNHLKEVSHTAGPLGICDEIGSVAALDEIAIILDKFVTVNKAEVPTELAKAVLEVLEVLSEVIADHLDSIDPDAEEDALIAKFRQQIEKL